MIAQVWGRGSVGWHELRGLERLQYQDLTVAAIGVVRDELRLCCAVPRPFTRCVVSSAVVTVGMECYRVGLRCTGYDAGCGVAEFSMVTAEAAPLGFFFGLSPWLLRGQGLPAVGMSGDRGRGRMIKKKQ